MAQLTITQAEARHRGRDYRHRPVAADRRRDPRGVVAGARRAPRPRLSRPDPDRRTSTSPPRRVRAGDAAALFAAPHGGLSRISAWSITATASARPSAGTPTTPTTKSRRWRRSSTASRSRRPAAAPASPACARPMTRCPTTSRRRLDGCARSTCSTITATTPARGRGEIRRAGDPPDGPHPPGARHEGGVLPHPQGRPTSRA